MKKKKRKNFLTIEERREIIYQGKLAPICMSDNTVDERRRKRELERKSKIFAKNMNR